jgi:hypothetical protein
MLLAVYYDFIYKVPLMCVTKQMYPRIVLILLILSV